MPMSEQPSLLTEQPCPTCAKAFTLGPDETLIVPCPNMNDGQAMATEFRNASVTANYHVAIVCTDAMHDMRYADIVKLVELIRGSLSVQKAVELVKQRALVIQKPGEWA